MIGNLPPVTPLVVSCIPTVIPPFPPGIPPSSLLGRRLEASPLMRRGKTGGGIAASTGRFRGRRPEGTHGPAADRKHSAGAASMECVGSRTSSNPVPSFLNAPTTPTGQVRQSASLFPRHGRCGDADAEMARRHIRDGPLGDAQPHGPGGHRVGGLQLPGSSRGRGCAENLRELLRTRDGDRHLQPAARQW